jgi:CubicO group peptidase (beta-lactamase class C family)
MRSIVRSTWFTLASAVSGRPSSSLLAPVSGSTGVLQPFVDGQILAGAVTLVASPDRLLNVEAVGYADVAARIPMRTDNLFWIASMSKPVTATALLMLVDEGRVQLDAPVETYLPEFRGQRLAVRRRRKDVVLTKPGHPITVREILSHTSGLASRSPLERELDTLPLRLASVTYGLLPLQFEPGTAYEYCNPGINTAGRIIEVVSRMPFEDFLQGRLFDPLGMKDTTFWPSEEQRGRLAKSYKPGSRKQGLEETSITQLTYPLTNRRRHPYPAGGLFSTAADVGVFGRMVLNGGNYEGCRYISESAVRLMTSTQTGALLSQGRGEGGYGLGWFTTRKARDSAVIPGPCGHGGAHGTHMELHPEHRLVTVYLVQHAGFPGVDGETIRGAFTRAALSQFGKPAGSDDGSPADPTRGPW